MMSDTLFSVQDRVTLVSGASRGIGKALAQAFAQRGAKVIITGREQSTLEQSAQEISPDGNAVTPIVCDVSDVETIPALKNQVVDRFGRIDILLNVAGVNKRKRVETVTVEEFDFILDINLRGAFFLAQEVGKQMLTQGAGVQVHIDSLNTYAPLKGVLPYAMSKAGLSMMTRGMATEWGPRGVRVNALAPGFILTAMTNKLWSIPTMQEWGKRNTPLGRLGEVSDLVGAAIFLASDASAFMTGQVIYVDGGMTAGINWPIELD
ncbi:MAG: SDR family NAD(P)-dependent oxidoreductase [Planctomycetaceae bacterium]